MKNKFLIFTVVFTLIFGLTACSKIEEEQDVQRPLVRYAVMTGPTGVGSVHFIENSKNGQSAFEIEESVVGTPDEIVSSLVSGNLDMAVVPANLASVLYNKTEGKIQVLATNNLGVLYIVEMGEEIHSLEDLKGKVVMSSGKGATPETVFTYLMEGNGLQRGVDWDFDFKTEATEAAQYLLSGKHTIALLPEPMVTAVLAQSEHARVAIDLQEEWSKLNASAQITGVLVGRREFIETIDADAFLKEFESSVKEAEADVKKTSELLGKYNIMNPDIAETAIPNMNLHYMDGQDLKISMTEYLQILSEANSQSVGGNVPGEDFFYLGK